MKSVLKILVGAICLCSFARAQIKYDTHPIAQKVQYDDDGETYQPYTSYERKDNLKDTLVGEYRKPTGSPYPQPQAYSNPSNEHASYYAPKAEYPKESTYYPAEESFKKKIPSEYLKPKAYDQDEELQYSQGPEKPSYYQPSGAPTSYQPSHYSSQPSKPSYQPIEHTSPYQPKSPEAYPVSYQSAKPSYYQPAQPSHYQSAQQPSHYQSAQQPSQYQPAQASHYQVSQPSHYQQPQQPSHYQPEASHPQPEAPTYQHGKQTSLVKRDPKLPLYFTMYEKRVIQDPTDKYGKGPWRYLTYGHGITYGSKEPGKVFEKGYGYIRALGRDHCKLPEDQCPPKDDKPFEYDGRKEPYFGYRPH